jgi:hypothetical protein
VIYTAGSLGIITDTVAMYDGEASIDSNLFVSTANTFERIGLACGYTNQTLSTWQNTYHFDENSSWQTTSPFDSVAAVDPWQGFARSSASNEMNRTYGGQTWTVYGAVQAASPACVATHSLSSTAVFKTSAIVIDNYSYDTDSTLSKFKVIWDDDSVAADPLGADSITSAFTSPDSLHIPGLTSGTQYWWRVILSVGGCSPDTSNHATFTTDVAGAGGRLKIEK